jgi:hypothetical protein
MSEQEHFEPPPQWSAERLREALSGFTSDDPAERLRSLTTVRGYLAGFEYEAVHLAREAGLGWRMIAAHLGVREQDVFRKYAPRMD